MMSPSAMPSRNIESAGTSAVRQIEDAKTTSSMEYPGRNRASGLARRQRFVDCVTKNICVLLASQLRLRSRFLVLYKRNGPRKSSFYPSTIKNWTGRECDLQRLNGRQGCGCAAIARKLCRSPAE